MKSLLTLLRGNRGPRVADPRPLSAGTYVVLDTELTGLDAQSDSIISIGALRMTGGVIHFDSAFHRLVTPRTHLKPASVVVHGITPSDTEGLPEIDAVLPEFLAYCGEAVLVGHMVSIDIRHLNREMMRVLGRPMTNHVVDTFALFSLLRRDEDRRCAFAAAPGSGNDLFSIARRYNIAVTKAHDALGDAFITAQIFQRFLAVLPARGVTTVGDLLRKGAPEGGPAWR